MQDIVGGTLLSSDGSVTIGAFTEPGVQGTYTVDVTWDQVKAAVTVPDGLGQVSVSLQVNFFDQAGHTTTGTVSVSMSCANYAGGSSLWLCEEACVDLQQANLDCGACHQRCLGATDNLQGSYDYCQAGQCQAGLEAVDPAQGGNCALACNKAGGTCVPNGCDDFGGTGFTAKGQDSTGTYKGVTGACSGVSLSGWTSLKCCCQGKTSN